MKKYLLSLGLTFLSLWALARENPDAQAWLGRNGLTFTENKGQVFDALGGRRPDILYTAEANGVSLYFRHSGVSYVFPKLEDRDADGAPEITALYRMDLELVGANPTPKVSSEAATDGLNNYYLPHAPEGITGVRSYRKITYQNVYPNIDLVFYATDENVLKYDFVVRPGGNPSDIRLKYTGAEKSALAKGGALEVNVPLGKIVEEAPVTFQHIGGKQQSVASQFRLDGNVVTFEVGAYDKAQTLVIDPLSRQWATFYGSTNLDRAYGVTNDGQGRVTVTGITQNAAFPVTVGNNMPQTVFGGINDAFATQFDANSGARLWSTFYGGSAIDQGLGVTCDKFRNVYITGYTTSTNFPLQTPMQATQGGGGDAFLVKLNQNGARQWATYYGGSGIDQANGAAADMDGNVFISGMTFSSNLNVPGAVQNHLASTGFRDAFLTKFNGTNGTVMWGTYYGGTGDDQGWGLAVNAGGDPVIAGQTNSTNLPLANAFQGALNGGLDAFVAKYNGGTGARLMSTYYGGNKDDHASAVAIDGAGNAYVVGFTVSDNLFTPNAFQGSNGSSGLRDGFIARINANNSLQWASYMGGTGNDEANAVACFSSGQVYIAGLTSSSDFPMLDSPMQSSLAGNNDMFVMGVSSNGVALNSTYYGGSGNDIARAVSGSASGALYVVGQTSSKNFPTQNAFQSQLNGNGQGASDDAFVLRFNGAAVCPTLTVTPTVTNIVCKGAATGGISLSLSGASGPFSFAWSGPNNFASLAQNISGLFAGSYTGVITYNNGACTVSANVNVTEPATGIMLDAIVTDVQCNGGSTGAISLDATGGVAPYTFMWTGPNGFTGNTANITGLMAGIYSGKVTDASGCAVTADVPVEQGPAINVAVDQLRNVSCGSGSDGAILISVSGGTGPYTFIWTGPNGFTSTTEDILGLRAGDYNGQITDAAGCVLNAPVTVLDGPQIVVTLENKKDVTCNGGSDGAIDISVSGGLAPYTFNWSGPNSFIATTEDISGLMAGNYVGVVIDANGCIVNPIPQVLIDQPVALTPSVSTNDPLLFCDNKSAVLMASPTSGVTYQWLLNGSPIAGAIDMTYVATMAGDYAVRVSNSNGCNAQSGALTLSTIPAPSAVISSFDQLIFCDGGHATLNLTTDAVDWTWLMNGDPAQTGGATFTALLEREYSVHAVGANGCESVSNILTTIVYPLPTAEIVPPGSVSLCQGEELQLEGMTDIGTNYQWQLNGIDIAGAMNSMYVVPANSMPGMYNYTVTVLNNVTGCVRQSLATIVTVNIRPTVSLSVMGDVTYCSNAVTPIVATVTDADKIEWWLNGSVVAMDVTSFSPSESGAYMVKVTNTTTGCMESSAMVNVTINPAPVVMVNNMGPVVTCMNNLVTITASGGDTYQWWLNGSPIAGATNASITPDASGDYMVVATFTATGCSETSAAINFTVNPMMVIDAGTDVIICEGDAVSLGNATMVASGGNGGPYTYMWAPAGSLNDATAANPVATPVVPTTYTLTVTDGAGNCMMMDQVIVFVNPSPKPVVTAGGVTLFCQDGTVQLTSVTPAPPTPSTYQWFRDDVMLAGATSPDYMVSMVGTAPTFANNYYLEVTGNNGCVGKSNMVSVTVYPDPDVTLTLSGPLTFCMGSSVTFTAPAYTPDALTNLVYQWFKDGNPVDGATSDNFTATESGAYFVNIKNSITGCEENSATQNVIVNPNPVADAGADMDLCLNGTPMMMGGSPAASGGTPGYTYSWAPTMGFDDPTLANPMLTQMASGTVIYTLTVTDVNGCMGTDEAIVLLKPNPVVTITAEFDRNKICDDGFINLTANVAPVPSYGIANYKWTNVTTGAVIMEGPAVTGITISDLVSTVNENYEALISVEVTSTDGCKGMSPDYNVTVFPNPNTTVTTTGSVSSCFGMTDLTISVPLPASASVLDAMLVYTWYRNGIIFKTGVATDPGINSYTLPANEPVGAHNYFVNIKNTVTGCEENTMPVFVTVYANPVANAGSDKTTCEGDNIMLDGSASGGTMAAYMYSWTPATLLSDATMATPMFLSPDPDATGTYMYSLIVSQDNSGTVCSSTADDVTVTVNQKPDVVITLQSPNDKLIFCEGGFVTMIASNTNGAVTVASYQWFKNNVAIAGATSATYSTMPSEGLNAAGDYMCEVTSTLGCMRQSAVQTVQVSALPIAVITRTSPAPYCEGLQNTLSADDAGNDPSIMIYEWRLNSVPLALNTGVAGDNVTITVSAPGNYEVLVSNSITNCKALSAPVQIYANPVANAGTDFTVCPDKATAITVVNGSASGGDGVYTYDWTGSVAALAYLSPTNIATPNFQQATYTPGVYNYTLTVTDGKGCMDMDDADVTVSDFATVGVMETEPSGCGTSDGVLAISVSGGKSPYTYRVFNALNLMYPEITDPSATYNYTGLPSGDYTVKVIDADGCEMVFAGSFSLTVQAPLFTVLQTSTDFLDLAWTNVSGATYDIQYRIVGEEDDNWQVFTGLDNTSTAPGASQTPSRRFLNLQNNTEYEFEIKALCSTGEVSPTTIDTFTTDIIPGVCPPPGGVFVNQMTYEAVNNFTSADVYWNLDVDAVAYDLEIRLQGTSNPTFTSVFTCIPATFLANASTVPGKAIFPLSNLFENSVYDVRVRKYCGPCTNSGLYSDIVTFETGGNCSALTTAFDAVANKTSACSDEGISLSLNLPSGLQPNLSFLWERSTDINGPYSIAQGTTDQPTYTATEVGTFFYRCEVTVGTCAPVASNPVVITIFEQPQVIAQVNQPLSCAASSDASIIAGCLPFGNCNPNDFEFSIDGITYQPNGFGGQFDNLGAGDYTVFIRNITTQCVGTFPISITFSPAVQIQSVDLVSTNRARATWTASPNAVKYQIRWRVIGSGDDGWANPRDADEDAANASLDTPTVPLDLATAESMPAATGAGSKGLRSDGQYEVQMRVMCAGNVFSAWSLPFPFSTDPIAATCGTVGSLYVDTDVTEAVVNWTEPSASTNAPICYQIRYRQTGSTVPFITVTSSTTQVILTGLLAGTSYDIQVRAICAGTCSNPSQLSAANTIRFQTQLFKDAAVSMKQNDAMFFSVYPNPNRGNFTVSFETMDAGAANLKVTDMTGRVIFEKSYNVAEGKNELPVEVSTYSAGVYLLQFQQGEQTRTTKLILN